MKKALGKDIVPPNVAKIMSDYIHSLDHLHESEKDHAFEDYDGKPLSTFLTKVTDVTQFIETICEIRSIKNPKIVLGADGGQQKCLVTMIIIDKDKENED